MSYLIFFFFLILAFFIILLSAGRQIIASILKILFGKPIDGEPSQNRSFYNRNKKSTPNTQNKKVFSKEEGEYIDFEEIKEK
ncbi:MAG: DUF4834 family protein [Dysgonomonas sp.]